MNCKLTDKNMQTRNGFQYTLGAWAETDGSGKLCTEGWLHYYRHPLLAVLHAPLHAISKYNRLFAIEVNGEQKHEGWLKSGTTRLRLTHEIELPKLAIEHRVRYAIYCAKDVYTEPQWLAWADAWLSGENRSNIEAARAAARAADAGAIPSAGVWAAEAARAASWAAEVARAVAWAARAAAEATCESLKTTDKVECLRLDLIAERAIDDENAYQEALK